MFITKKDAVAIPTSTEIMAMTQEQIDALPCYNEMDKVTLGGFARKTWALAPSSLVIIIQKDGCNLAYMNVNKFNGVISDTCYAGMVFEREYLGGGKFWKCEPFNMYSITDYLKEAPYCFQCGEVLSPDNNGVVINKGTPHETAQCNDCHNIELGINLDTALLEYK